MQMNKTTLYALVALLVLIIGLSTLFYFKGKKNGSVEQVPLPQKFEDNEGKTIVFTQDDSEEVRGITLALFEDLDGMSFGMRNTELYEKLATIDDYLFVAVYNDFNTYYKKELDGETLRDWLKDDDFSFYKETFSIIMARFDKWNLK